jgi:uncharacterized membrane protein YdbT with pleckstrin-like domain
MSIYLKKFIAQKSYENIVYFLRRDTVVFLKTSLIFIFLLAVPFGAYYFLQSFYPTIFENTLVFPILVMFFSVYFLSVWLVFFTAFIDYYLDFWVVTNDRIINVEQHLFSRVISELDLYKIQDVTTEIKGVLPTLFNYGNVHIQTAGALERFVFEEVPNPRQVAEKIMELAEEDRKYHVVTPTTGKTNGV